MNFQHESQATTYGDFFGKTTASQNALDDHSTALLLAASEFSVDFALRLLDSASFSDLFAAAPDAPPINLWCSRFAKTAHDRREQEKTS